MTMSAKNHDHEINMVIITKMNRQGDLMQLKKKHAKK